MSASTSATALLLPLLALGLAASTCWGLIRFALKRQRFTDVLDQPNERSLHESPVPRIGGYLMMQSIAIALLVVGGWYSLADRCPPAATCFWPGLNTYQAILASLPLLLGAGLLTWIGRLDDRGPLSIKPRLLAHLACAALVAFSVSPSAATSLGLALGSLADAPESLITILVFIIITLSVAWLTNLYNFMDGSNGLAGLMTLIGFATYALMAPTGTALEFLSAACAGAALGFLLFNWDPAQIFMGDAGSIPLGFLAAAIGLTGAQAGYWSWFLPLGLFLPFIFDATTTLALRAWRGERITAAHRSHAYQILVMSGLGHHRTALLFGGLMVICSLTSATSSYLSDPVKWAVWAVIILIHAGVVMVARLKSS